MAKKNLETKAAKGAGKSSRSKSTNSKSRPTLPKSKQPKTSPLISCPEADCDKTFKTTGGLHKHKLAKHPGIVRPAPGRPLLFETDADLQKAIKDYFTSCEPQWIEELEWVEAYHYVDLNEGVADAKPNFQKTLKVDEDTGKVEYIKRIKMIKKDAVVPTISGLAYALDTTRRTLLDYQEKDEYSHTIKRAKQFIEAANEALLVNGGVVPSGVIFNLKNNWGWVDRQELDVMDKAEAARKSLDNLEKAAEANDDYASEAERALKDAKA